MFASSNPALFLIHIIGALFILLMTCVAGWLLSQPLLFAVAVLGLGALPQFPVLDGSPDEEEPPANDDYHGGKEFGFAPTEKS